MSKQKVAKGLPSRTGKRKAVRAQYYGGSFLRNKLRRILDGNGVDAAVAWAAAHSCDRILREIRERRN